MVSSGKGWNGSARIFPVEIGVCQRSRRADNPPSPVFRRAMERENGFFIHEEQV
jgi:hypothetical protein